MLESQDVDKASLREKAQRQVVLCNIDSKQSCARHVPQCLHPRQVNSTLTTHLTPVICDPHARTYLFRLLTFLYCRIYSNYLNVFSKSMGGNLMGAVFFVWQNTYSATWSRKLECFIAY